MEKKYITRNINFLNHSQLVHVLHMVASEVKQEDMQERDQSVMIEFTKLSPELVKCVYDFVAECLADSEWARFVATCPNKYADR